ncbi:MAG: MerR family transcriptional regulator [Alphaproteobacteria bacterium]
MEKTNEYFSSINDVSKRLDVPAHTLRYWEKQFPVAIRPTTGAGGRRYYRTETVEKLIVIRDLLYKHGLTIAGVKKLLRDGNLPTTVDEVLMDTDGAPNFIAAPVSENNNSDLDLAISLLESAKQILQ